MNAKSGRGHLTKKTAAKPAVSLSQPGILQRACACGGAAGLTGKCEACASQPLSGQLGATENISTDTPNIPVQQAKTKGYRFQDLAIRPKKRFGIQAKLIIGQPGDKYEQEADRVAAQVVRQINAPYTQPIPSQQQGMAEAKAGQANVRTKPLVQCKADVSTVASADLESSIESVRGQGQPLESNVRNPMERAFGTDFSGVKVHTDAQSNQMNQALQARAFTTGQDIFFRQGDYQPRSQDGQGLLAHELTHVVQQTGIPQQQSSLSNPKEAREELMKASQRWELRDKRSDEEDLPEEDEDRVETPGRSAVGFRRSDEEDLPEEDEDRVETPGRSEAGFRRSDEEDLPEEDERTEAVAFAQAKRINPQAVNKNVKTKDIDVSRAQPANPVVQHLQKLSGNHAPAKALYRQEIQQFQKQNPTSVIQRQQKELLASSSSVKVNQKSNNSKILRAKGGVSFPSYRQIIRNGTVRSATNQAWQNTLAAATPTSRREEGFWIRKNMNSGNYSVTPTVTGPSVGPGQGATISLGTRPADNPPVYTVASFHTHTPTTHRTVGRAVGPSGADRRADASDDVAGVVYDYRAVSGGNIPAGHPLNSAARLYRSRNKRRRV